MQREPRLGLWLSLPLLHLNALIVCASLSVGGEEGGLK